MNRTRTKHMGYFDMVEAFRKAQICALCEMEVRDTHRHLDGLLYENVNDGGVRKELIQSRGYCRRHAHLLLAFGDGLETAALYQDQIKLILEFLESLRGISAKLFRKERGRHWNISDTCPACKLDKQRRDGLVSILVEWLDDPEMRSAIEQSPGLCVPHLLLVIGQIKDPAIRDDFLALHIEKFSGLAAEMTEFSRKFDYRFSGEGFGEEKDSWIRAVKMMVGDKQIL